VKTWWDGVKKDMKKIGLCWEDAEDQSEWRRKVNRATG